MTDHDVRWTDAARDDLKSIVDYVEATILPVHANASRNCFIPFSANFTCRSSSGSESVSL